MIDVDGKIVSYTKHSDPDNTRQTSEMTVVLSLEKGQKVSITNDISGTVHGATGFMYTWFCGYMIAAL